MSIKSLFARRLTRFCGSLVAPGLVAMLIVLFSPSNLSAQAMPFGFNPYQFQNVEIGGGGGFITGIVFSTAQSGLVYARTDIGGAYRFDPDSGRWIPLLDWIGYPDWNLSGVESIAIDPLKPHRVYFAVGTYTNDYTSENGAILRSENDGHTFKRVDLPFKVGSNMPGRGMGERLAIDPNNDRVLYLGTRSGNGLWRSTDGGDTWTKVTNFPDTGPYHEPSTGPSDTYDNDPIGVVWETFDPRTTVRVGNMKVSQNIYVGVADPANSLWHSPDGGQTWTAVANQPTGVMPHHGKLASNGVLYLSYNNNAGPYDGTAGDVWKYDTGSQTWSKITPPASPLNGGYGFGGLSVDAENPNTIVVAALNQWWPDTQIFRTLDGGNNWSLIWNVSFYPQVWPNIMVPTYSLSYASVAPWLTFGATPATCTSAASTNSLCPQPSPKLGWMVEALEVDPFNSNHMLYGTGATMYGTDNLTAWDSGGTVDISVAAVGIEETAVQDLISPPSGTAHLISAIADVGGFTHNDLTMPSVMDENPVLTTGTSLDFAELNPSFVVRVGTGGSNGNIGFSPDGGQTWTPGTSPSGASGGSVAAAADGSRVVWSSGSGVFVSADDGATWAASSGAPAGASVRSDRVNPLRFYAFGNGMFYASIDGGLTFAATAASNLPPAGAPAQFKATPGHEGDIWLAGGTTGTVQGIWHSLDGGNSFFKVWGVEAANTIGFGKAAPFLPPFFRYPALYSSAEVCGQWGIYRSDDAGFTWVRVNDDQHQYALTNACITGDPRIYGRVYICTNGRGIIYGDPK